MIEFTFTEAEFEYLLDVMIQWAGFTFAMLLSVYIPFVAYQIFTRAATDD